MTSHSPSFPHSHFIMSDALGNLALGQAEESAQWYVHKYLSTWIPYVTDMALGPRAIVVNYLIQSVLGLLLGTLLTIHFSPPRDNPNMVLKGRSFSIDVMKVTVTCCRD